MSIRPLDPENPAPPPPGYTLAGEGQRMQLVPAEPDTPPQPRVRKKPPFDRSPLGRRLRSDDDLRSYLGGWR
jgi:hypothetical protein